MGVVRVLKVPMDMRGFKGFEVYRGFKGFEDFKGGGAVRVLRSTDNSKGF